MRKADICRKNICTGGENNTEISYYITIDEMLDCNGINLLENYGVGIRIAESGEEDNVKCITVDSRKIFNIVEILANGSVTPVGLRDVLYDLLEVI